MNIDLKAVFSVSLVLFAVIDILGSIPLVIELRKRNGTIFSGKATFVAGTIMIAFLFLGESILGLFGLDIPSFAIAGAIVMFLLGMEMILGLTIFKSDDSDTGSASIVPLAFPVIAGAGTMTTIISLKAQYSNVNIIIGIIINLIVVYIVLKSCVWIEKKIGTGGANILRKVFGIILLAISIKMFKTHI